MTHNSIQLPVYFSYLNVLSRSIYYYSIFHSFINQIIMKLLFNQLLITMLGFLEGENQLESCNYNKIRIGELK